MPFPQSSGPKMCCPTHEFHLGLWAEQGVFWVQGMVRMAFALRHEAVHPLSSEGSSSPGLAQRDLCFLPETWYFWVLPHLGASRIQLQKLGGFPDPLF